MTKKTFFALLTAAMMCVPFTMSAQVTVGSGRAPSEWSVLDLCTDYQRKGLHNARMNTAERDLLIPPGTENIPAGGLMIFNTDGIEPGIGCLEFWNGREWISLCAETRPSPQISQPDFYPDTRAVCPGECVLTLAPAFWITDSIALTAGTEVAYQWQRLIDGTWEDVAGVEADGGLSHNVPMITLPAQFRRIAACVRYGSTHTSNVLTVTEIQRTNHPNFAAKRIVGLYWATHNIDLSRINQGRVTAHPSDGGMFFQWGRVHGWESSTSANAPYNQRPARQWQQNRRAFYGGGEGWAYTRYFPAILDGHPISWLYTISWGGSNIWGLGPLSYHYDPCRIKGAGWRLPTAQEHQALIDNSTHYWLTAIETAEDLGFGCMPGRVFRNPANPANDWVFFPAVGFRERDTGLQGGIWGGARGAYYANSSSSHDVDAPTNYQNPMRINFQNVIHLQNRHRQVASAVRCVRNTPMP